MTVHVPSLKFHLIQTISKVKQQARLRTRFLQFNHTTFGLDTQPLAIFNPKQGIQNRPKTEHELQ